MYDCSLLLLGFAMYEHVIFIDTRSISTVCRVSNNSTNSISSKICLKSIVGRYIKFSLQTNEVLVRALCSVLPNVRSISMC
jgi:hypothetical protein